MIGLKELRENMNTYAAEVQKGKSFIVVRRSKLLFRITPPDDANELWETAVDFTEFYKDGISAKQLLKKIQALNEKSR